MDCVRKQTLDAERALYGTGPLLVKECRFDGPADGESPLKECRNITVEDCFFNLRYPFWHDRGLCIQNSELTPQCRAALWYSENIVIRYTRLHGIKALRECRNVRMQDCEIRSPEFGWSVNGLAMERCTAESEYFMLRAENLRFQKVEMKGKYSFQYIQNSVFDNCVFDTKDAFWHAKNVVVKNSVVKGEYLGWYSENVTFDHCRIIGTQPLCYCRNLVLIDCEMEQTDLAFEKSEVQATLTSPVLSVKNPASGCITAPSVGEIIRDDPASHGIVKTSCPAHFCA